MGDQMALPSLAFTPFGDPGFFAVSSVSPVMAFSASHRQSQRASTSASMAEMPFAFDALFLQPRFITRAVYFERMHDGETLGLGLVDDGAMGERSDFSKSNQDSFADFDDFAEALANADSVMDALVRLEDMRGDVSDIGDISGMGDISTTGKQSGTRSDTESKFRPNVDGQMSQKREKRFHHNQPSFGGQRVVVGLVSFCLVIAAATVCAQLVLLVTEWVCRVLFGEEEDEETEGDHSEMSVAEVSHATPLLVDFDDDAVNLVDFAKDGEEQLLVIVPMEPEGRRTQ
tara:strand:- start:21636 stop:22496 length:861 start_codon:yes stop_codon:yes gene_type:complete